MNGTETLEGAALRCRCGRCRLAGDRTISGGIVLWFVAPGCGLGTPEYSRGLCSQCRDTTKVVVERARRALTNNLAGHRRQA